MNSIKNKKIFAGALFAIVFSFGVFGLAKADNTLTINKSGSGYGKVIIKNSTGGELQTCDFTGSATSCEYSQSGTNGVILFVKPSSGSSYGGHSGCNNGSNLNVDNFNETQHCGVQMGNNSSITFTINSGSSSTSNSSNSSNSSSSTTGSSGDYTLTIKNSGSGSGYVLFYERKDNKDTYKKNCPLTTGASCKYTASSGSYIRMYAKPYQSSFDSWSGCDSTQKFVKDNDLCNATNISGDKTLTVSFTKSTSSSSSSSSSSSVSAATKQYTLKVSVTGAGQIQGYLKSTGEKVIDCKKVIDGKKLVLDSGNKKCSVEINSGENVELSTRNSSTQYEFATWAGDCRGSNGNCNLTIKSNKAVSVTFNKKAGTSENRVTVSIRKTGKGSGKVISMNSRGGSLSGINCGTDCSENFEQYCEAIEGSRSCGMVYFKAKADKDSTFGGFGGDCLSLSGKTDQCYIILDGGKSITANFNEGKNNVSGKYYDLKVTVPAGGTVKSTDGKIDCSSDNSPCEHSYGKNGTVTLKITPNSGYSLSSTGGCSYNKYKNTDGSYTCKVKMTKKQNLTVNFKATETSSSSSANSSSSSASVSAIKSTTKSATNITSTSATLNGVVEPNGNTAYYIFSYRKESEASSKTKYTPSSYSSVNGTSGEISVSADISGLSSGTKYLYRVYTYSSTTGKNGSGALGSFTTSGGSSSSSSSSN